MDVLCSDMLLCPSLDTLHNIVCVCVFALYNMTYECIDGMFLLVMNTRFHIVIVVSLLHI